MIGIVRGHCANCKAAVGHTGIPFTCPTCGAQLRCSCGAAISPDDELCTNCKQNLKWAYDLATFVATIPLSVEPSRFDRSAVKTTQPRRVFA